MFHDRLGRSVSMGDLLIFDDDPHLLYIFLGRPDDVPSERYWLWSVFLGRTSTLGAWDPLLWRVLSRG